MTEEEKQAYFAAQRKKALDGCTIKTKEQFIEQCRISGIPEEWYGFNCGRKRPVSVEDDMVLYRKIGKTLVSYPFQRWDIAYEELLRYKDEYDAFISARTSLRIDIVRCETNAEIIAGSSNKYPFVDIRRTDYSETIEGDPIGDGWIYDGYDRYMGYSSYHKTVDIRTLDFYIVFEFTKLTDERDRKELGLYEAFMRGSYRYPVPYDLKERILGRIHAYGEITDELKALIERRYLDTLKDDEYLSLVKLKKEHLDSLLYSIDAGLTVKEQKKAFAEAGKKAEAGNPAVDDCFGSRSNVIINDNFDLAYERAGIAKI